MSDEAYNKKEESKECVLTDPDDLVLAQGGQADGTSRIRHEVHKRGDEGDDTTIRMKTVGDGAHAVLADTVPDVRALVAAEARARGLEVLRALDLRQVAARQIGRPAEKLGERGRDGGQDDLGELARGLRGVGRLVDGERLLPAAGELAGDAAHELGVLGGVLLGVRRERGSPLLLEDGTALADFGVGGVDLLRDVEGRVGIEVDLRLESGDIVCLESCGSRFNRDSAENSGTEAAHGRHGHRGCPAAWSRSRWLSAGG